MTVTPATRKPVNLLSEEDLCSYPIWEYCLDEELTEDQDETWVRPVVTDSIPADAWSVQVAATLTFQDGSCHKGLMDITTAPEEDVVTIPDHAVCDQPDAAILSEGQQYHVDRKGRRSFAESRAVLVQAFARDLTSIFPIKYELQVLVEGEAEPRQGVLH